MCNLCGRSFARSDNFLSHKRTHVKNGFLDAEDVRINDEEYAVAPPEMTQQRSGNRDIHFSHDGHGPFPPQRHGESATHYPDVPVNRLLALERLEDIRRRKAALDMRQAEILQALSVQRPL